MHFCRPKMALKEHIYFWREELGEVQKPWVEVTLLTVCAPRSAYGNILATQRKQKKFTFFIAK